MGQPHWTGMVSALAIAIVAVIGAFIAWNLWHTNREILRERLYDRRYILFEASQALITEIIEQGGLTWNDVNRFDTIAQQARFMFSKDDAEYFEQLRRKAAELAQITSLTDSQLRSQASIQREEQQVLCDWFNDQVEEVFLRMNKYLLFDR